MKVFSFWWVLGVVGVLTTGGGYALTDISGNFNSFADSPNTALPTDKDLRLVGDTGVGWHLPNNLAKNFDINGYTLTFGLGGNKRGVFGGVYSGAGQLVFQGLVNNSIVVRLGGEQHNTFSGTLVIVSGQFGAGSKAGMLFTSGPIVLGRDSAVQLDFVVDGSVSALSPLTSKRPNNFIFLNGTSQEFGALTLEKSLNIDLGESAGELRFADSSAQTWGNDSILKIYKYIDGQSKIYFGDSSEALTAAQLAAIKLIKFNDSTEFDVTLASDGELVFEELRPPENPVPLDQAMGTALTPTLYWDPVVGAEGYELYLWPVGAEEPAEPLAGNLVKPMYPMTSLLDGGTEYQWRVLAYDIGRQVTGTVWHFTTESFDPKKPILPVPFDGATEILPDTELRWSVPQAAARYQVYLWPLNEAKPMAPIGEVTEPVYAPLDDLQDNTTWFWQIVAIDAANNEITSPEWSFTTARTVTGLVFHWNGMGPTENWSDPANWVDWLQPSLTNDIVEVVQNSLVPSRNIIIDQDVVLTGLHFKQNDLSSMTVKSTDGAKIHLAEHGTIALHFPNNQPNNQTITITAPIVLQGAATFVNYRSSQLGLVLDFKGEIIGSDTLYIAGVGMNDPTYWGVTLSGDNPSFTGGLAVTNQAALRLLPQAVANMQRPLRLTNGRVCFGVGAPFAFAAGIEIEGDVLFHTKSGSKVATAIRLSNAAKMQVCFDANSVGNSTISGNISGNGRLEVLTLGLTQACSLFLEGTNTYSGATVVEAHRILGGSNGILPINAQYFNTELIEPIVVRGTLDLSAGLKLDLGNAATSVTSRAWQPLIDYSQGVLQLEDKELQDVFLPLPRWEFMNNDAEGKVYGRPWVPLGSVLLLK